MPQSNYGLKGTLALFLNPVMHLTPERYTLFATLPIPPLHPIDSTSPPYRLKRDSLSIETRESGAASLPPSLPEFHPSHRRRGIELLKNDNLEHLKQAPSTRCGADGKQPHGYLSASNERRLTKIPIVLYFGDYIPETPTAPWDGPQVCGYDKPAGLEVFHLVP